ncbi:MAG: ABC transporter ATP-binding protein [Bacteroidetes bacterium]|nr:ABC transporter ATP-binding protein [Bacteroidota bacterium]
MIEITHAIVGHQQPLIEIEDLILKKGKVYAIIGRNGGGKSTLLNSLLGHVPLMSGNIQIDGMNVHSLRRSVLAKHVAFVASKFDGIEYLKVRDYVALGKFGSSSLMGTLQAEDIQHIEQLLEELALLPLADKFTDRISDGERQLAAVARALAQDTPVLLLDEPTAFLDYKNKKRMMEKLVEIAEQKNKCIVFSSHDLALAMDNAVIFLAIHRGRLEILQQLEKENITYYFE